MNFVSKTLKRITSHARFGVMLLVLLCFPGTVLAAEFSVTPALIDAKGKAREILRYTAVVENTTDHLISIYPWVVDLDPALGATAHSDLEGSDRKEIGESLARWVQVTRGVIDLLPGDRREIPILIQINLNAKPGAYHALIRFSSGPNRKEAEANIAQTSDIVLNLDVLDESNVRLQLGGFTADKNFFIDDEASFSYLVENIGNRGVAPSGKIRIFDRKGEEVAEIAANDLATKIEPNAKTQLAAVWTSGGKFGKYKAMLDLRYGQSGTIQDTVFFWVLPLGRLLSYFITLAIVIAAIFLLMHSRATSRRIALLHARTHVSHGSDAYEGPAEHHPSHLARTRRVRSSDVGSAEKHARLPDKATRVHEHAHRVTISPRTKRSIDPGHIVNLRSR